MGHSIAKPKADGERAAVAAADDDFSFLPTTLVDRCRTLIVGYHELNGYSCLPDMLWRPDPRRFIRQNRQLDVLFRTALASRSARRANEGLVLIATMILSTEILASGFAGWGTRFPEASRKAQRLFAEYTPGACAALMRRYLARRSTRTARF